MSNFNTTFVAPNALKTSSVQSKIEAQIGSITDLFESIRQIITELDSVQEQNQKPANTTTRKPTNQNQSTGKPLNLPNQIIKTGDVAFTNERKTKARLALQQTKLKLDEAKRLLQGIVEG